MAIIAGQTAEWEAADIFHSNILVFWIKRNVWLSLTIFMCNTYSQTCRWWSWGSFVQVEQFKALLPNNGVLKTWPMLFSEQEMNHPEVISRGTLLNQGTASSVFLSGTRLWFFFFPLLQILRCKGKGTWIGSSSREVLLERFPMYPVLGKHLSENEGLLFVS